jgi:DNA polymerase-3 subunit epsilon
VPSLTELDVLIVDCQTTGATPSQGAVLELGWSVVRASAGAAEIAAQAHWIALPEGERISAAVRRLTGFEERFASGALAPEAAWQRLREAMPVAGTMPAAIHFARFELTFLRAWCERFEPGASFPIDAACVHAIACRLYPELPRRNLRALSGFLGHGLHLERRALGHVLATEFIWKKLALELEQRGISSWPELKDFLAGKAGRPRARSYALPRERYRSLPEEPGVYRFLRSNGDVLYVGKAASLRKRVTSHFTKRAGATERALEMLTQTADVDFTPAATPLEAALLESELIKSLNPPYNLQLMQGERGVWFSNSDYSSLVALPDAQHVLGPLPSRYAVGSLGALLELLAGEPCSTRRRAAAVGASPLWAPDEGAFVAGYASFLERMLPLPSSAEQSPRVLARRIARRALLLAGARSDESVEALESRELVQAVWDPERVCRHLERALVQAYQVLRRASWLCWLCESSVYYREPGHESGRLLLLRAGALVASSCASGALALPIPERAGPPRAMRQISFDLRRYDRLRVLTTELKRVLRDGGCASVRLTARRVLRDAELAKVLALT